jgi:hypothetical protein
MIFVVLYEFTTNMIYEKYKLFSKVYYAMLSLQDVLYLCFLWCSPTDESQHTPRDYKLNVNAMLAIFVLSF